MYVKIFPENFLRVVWFLAGKFIYYYYTLKFDQRCITRGT